MRAFDYSSAKTVDETIQLLASDAGVKALAGGTDLITLMKGDIASPAHLVDIKRLDEIADTIKSTAQGIELGALTTLAQIELSEEIQNNYAVLAQAAESAATPQLRNMATIGGNLLQRPRCWYFRHANFHCWLKGGEECFAQEGENQLHALFGESPCVAVHPSDLASALLSLNATVRLRGPKGERTLSLEDFFTLPEENHRSETAIAPDELLLSIHLPKQAQGVRSTYTKAMDRKVWAFALAGVAAWVRFDKQNVAEARLVLSGVAPVPWRIPAAEEFLVGKPLSDAYINRAVEIALDGVAPLEHNGYKVPLVQSLLQRSLSTLAQN